MILTIRRQSVRIALLFVALAPVAFSTQTYAQDAGAAGTNTPAGDTPGATGGAGTPSNGGPNGAAGTGTGTNGTADGNAAATLSKGDRKFLMDAAQASANEIDLGTLAQQRGSSDSIRQFGTQMITDHTKQTTQFTPLASQYDVQLPASPDKKHQRSHDSLSKLNGTSFDQSYIKGQVADHQNALKVFQRESTDGANPQLRQLATTNLPTLQQHLQMAQDIQAGRTPAMSPGGMNNGAAGNGAAGNGAAGNGAAGNGAAGNGAAGNGAAGNGAAGQ